MAAAPDATRVIISVDDVVREAEKIAGEGPSQERIAELAGNAPHVTIDGLNAGYGKMEILHDFNLQVAKRQSLCPIGPNGAGKSTVLQDNSVLLDMTVEENVWMGGYLKGSPKEAKEAAERVFDKYPRLAARRKQSARVLSGGERRLLEISRLLVKETDILLVEEPSIGLEPGNVKRFVSGRRGWVLPGLSFRG